MPLYKCGESNCPGHQSFAVTCSTPRLLIEPAVLATFHEEETQPMVVDQRLKQFLSQSRKRLNRRATRTR
jgi:hypothetical protein